MQNEIKGHDNSKKFQKKLSKYIKSVQTIVLITVVQDDIRIYKDQILKDDKLTLEARDVLLNDTFYDLILPEQHRVI